MHHFLNLSYNHIRYLITFLIISFQMCYCVSNVLMCPGEVPILTKAFLTDSNRHFSSSRMNVQLFFNVNSTN